MENLTIHLTESAADVVSVRADHEALRLLDDDSLVSFNERISVHRRYLDLYAAAVAGDLAQRSRHELGFSGLAQRKGFTSTEALVQSLSELPRRGGQARPGGEDTVRGGCCGGGIDR